MKEHSKVYKARSERKVPELSKRLGNYSEKIEENKDEFGAPLKRRKKGP